MTEKVKSDEWFDKYKPIPNGMDEGTYFAVDGINFSFETYGKELDFILDQMAQKQNDQNIWTLLECDGTTVISNGYHLVNRLAYFVCENKWTGEKGQIDYIDFLEGVSDE